MSVQLTPIDPQRLRRDLLAAGYVVDDVLDRIGEAGQQGLGRNSTVPADVALGVATDPLAALIRLFVLQREVPEEQLAGVVDVAGLLDGGYLVRRGTGLAAAVDIRPYGSPDDDATGWIVADPTPGLDQVVEPTSPDYVLGVSPASTTLAQITMRTLVESALDLGTGCGVQSLHLSRHAQSVVGTDVNDRALRLAALTAGLNGRDVDLRNGSVAGGCTGAGGCNFTLHERNHLRNRSMMSIDDERLRSRVGDGPQHRR